MFSVLVLLEDSENVWSDHLRQKMANPAAKNRFFHFRHAVPPDPPHTQCTNTDVDFAAVWVLTEAFGNIAKQLTPRLTKRYTRIYVPANRFQKLSLWWWPQIYENP